MITNFEWYVRTQFFTDYELQEELKRLNDNNWELVDAKIIADDPNDVKSSKVSIIAKKQI